MIISSKFRNKYRIASSRWQNWDYGSNAAYFVTICTRYHICYFGDIVLMPEKTMQFTQIGSIAHQYWIDIPNHFPFVELDAFVIMPNHVHGIIVINKNSHETDGYLVTSVETQNLASLHALHKQPAMEYTGNKFGPQSKNLASIIRSYKTGVKKYATINHFDFTWQSRFHNHVIRDYIESIFIEDYIKKISTIGKTIPFMYPINTGFMQLNSSD